MSTANTTFIISNSTGTLAKKTPNDLRDELTDMVIRDLLGPAGGPDEELSQYEDHAYQRYLVGMLAPRDSAIAGSELDELATSDGDEGEEGAPESGVPAGNTYFPSSMGMSFVIDNEVTQIVVEAEWGQYLRIKSGVQQNKDGNPANVWKRKPVCAHPINLQLHDGNIGPRILHPDHPLVLLQGRIRSTPDGWVVTLFMVNQQEERKGRSEPKDEVWVFQPKLRVRGVEHQPIFVQRRHAKVDLSKMDPLTREESETLEMLYRHQREFAVGHGISVHATLPEPLAECAIQVETEWVPIFEVPQQTPRSAADDKNLAGMTMDMKLLAELSKDELIASLRHIETAYQVWIKMEEAKLSLPSEKLAGHEDAAKRTVDCCTRALQRIKTGIDLIQTNPLAEEAFRFANRAMWQQRIHSIFSRKVRKKEMRVEDIVATVDLEQYRSWRLFQLAFILLNLPSLTDLHHPDRSHETDAVADLLWFATGGGKTEAYLGLTAYTLALRRLQTMEGHRGDHGIAVLMRYTLRLLTLQQFQRATALICACEVIRRADIDKWGETPFRLGLWVGNKTTPNTLASAANVLRQRNVGGRPSSTGTPHQITSCPLCGSEIKEQHLRVYEAPSDIGRCITYCGDDLGRCEFTEKNSPKEGLPVMIVDEDIYRRPPSLLIATVDKFAQMPWKGETQMLFGKVNAICDRHGFLSPEVKDGQSHPARSGLPSVKNRPHPFLRPPDLIIQDELHLISGPLGSMVGLYETAVDELCSWEVDGQKVRPKVIASTATIRRAPDQVQKLFVRKLEVFPPQGTNIRDSFFAIQRPTGQDHPGRRYLGISAFGRRYPVAMIRSYVAHMAAAQVLYDKYDRLADPWMTLTGYFNSIRELAGTRRLVEDDIRARLRDADQRGLAKRRIRMGSVEELTSRKSGVDIPKILERMEATFDKTLEAQRAAERKEKKPVTSSIPYDVILATNMISVGVDIDRLGLMLVAGQPKNTSEYIQATSRIGRSTSSPGLVCTVFNWARPRDLSHYERFEHYHETFYKHVEALSITPFSARALDRGLSGVMVGLLRLWDDHLNGNMKAGEIPDTDSLWATVFDILSRRGGNATEDPTVTIRIKEMLERRRDEWLRRVHNQKDHKLCYKPEGGATVGLLEQASEKDWEMFTCLNSLRDVEGTVNLVLDQRTAGLHTD